MTSKAELTDRFLLTDQVAIITGAGKGIGAAIATTFAAAGADVVLTARTEADLESVAAEVRALGRRALVLPGNVNDLGELANIVDRTIAEFGRHQLGEMRLRVFREAVRERSAQRMLAGNRTDVDNRSVVA